MIGAIADDFTGGTDVAVAFRRAGLRTVVVFGDPADVEVLPDHDALVVALKTRTIEPEEAVRESVAAARWLQARGADQLFFKYCSTFDSRPEGNIGPVADALADLVGSTRAAVVPSSPEHLRTQYKGYLFVDDVLLSESAMRHHPLTPMTDSSIPRVLRSQTSRAVALVPLAEVERGSEQIRDRFDEAERLGARYVVVDAVTEQNLVEIGFACLADPLVTGAAGLAGGLGVARSEMLRASGGEPVGPLTVDPIGHAAAAVLAGSCSARTLEQVAYMQQIHDSFRLDLFVTSDPRQLADLALDWFDASPRSAAPLIYSSLPPAELRQVQDTFGVDTASAILETAMGFVAQGMVARGVRRIVVAGGETSGAVVTALNVSGGTIGGEAAPGVPWIYTEGATPLALLLKSGNFGDRTLLARAVDESADVENAA